MSNEPTQVSLPANRQPFYEGETLINGIHALTVGDLSANPEAAQVIAAQMNEAFAGVEEIQNITNITETLQRLPNSRHSILYVLVENGQLVSTAIASLQREYSSVPTESRFATIQLSGLSTRNEEGVRGKKNATKISQHIAKNVVDDMQKKMAQKVVLAEETDKVELETVITQLKNAPVIFLSYKEDMGYIGRMALNVANEAGWVTDPEILSGYSAITFQLDDFGHEGDYSNIAVELDSTQVASDKDLHVPAITIHRGGFRHQMRSFDEARAFIITLYEELNGANSGHNVVQEDDDGFIYGTALHGAIAGNTARKLLDRFKEEWGIEGETKTTETKLTFRRA